MKKFSRSKLYCFTPLVTLLTFIVEFALALYVLYKERGTKLGNAIILFLLSLSSFQLAEYMMCTVTENQGFWVRLGWVGITILPVLGLHIVKVGNNKKLGLAVISGWLIAAGLSAWLILSPEPLLTYTCTGHFVAFKSIEPFHFLHYWYYVIFLAGATLQAGSYAFKGLKKEMNIWMIVGFLTFVFPALLLAQLSEKAATGVPSIMCGFAIIAAFIVVVKVLPASKKK